MTNGDRIDFVWRTHTFINDYIRLADAKAAALLATFGGLLALLSRQFIDHEAYDIFWKVVVFAIGLALTSLVLLFSLNVIRPRSRPSPSGSIYWLNIRDLTAEGYANRIEKFDDAEALRAIANHTYEIAGTAADKYGALHAAFLLAYLALPPVLLGAIVF